MSDLLRDRLHEAAHEVHQVDLRDRVLAASRTATRRRRIAYGAVAVAAVAAGLFAGGFPSRDAAQQPARPRPGGTSAPLSSPPAPEAAGPWSGRADPPADRTLDGMALTVPEWPAAKPGETCPGPAVLTGGTATVPGGERAQGLRLVKAVTGELAGGPAVVALFYCDHGRRGYQFQVVAYRRTDRLEPLGQVLASRPEAIETMSDVTVAGDEVRIEVGDWAAGATVGEDAHYSVRQWRSYRWIGGPFQQSGGPLTFPPNPNFHDLAVTAPDLRLDPDVFGVRHGTLTATVTNHGPGDAPAGTAAVTLRGSMTFQPGTSICPTGEWSARGTDLVCPYGRLKPGASVRIVVAVTVGAAAATELSAATMRVTLTDDPGDQVSRGDNNRVDNSVPYRVTLA